MTEPHGFSYEFESTNAPGHSTFATRAHGDLDGDGVTSTFELMGESRDNELPRVLELRVYREVE